MNVCQLTAKKINMIQWSKKSNLDNGRWKSIKILVPLSSWPSWVGKISCRGKWQPTPVFLPGRNSMDRGARTRLRDSHVCAHTHTHTHTHTVTCGILVWSCISGHWKQSLGVQTWGQCTISVAICFQFRSIHSNLLPPTPILITTSWPLKQIMIRNLRGIPRICWNTS